MKATRVLIVGSLRWFEAAHASNATHAAPAQDARDILPKSLKSLGEARWLPPSV